MGQGGCRFWALQPIWSWQECEGLRTGRLALVSDSMWKSQVGQAARHQSSQRARRLGSMIYRFSLFRLNQNHKDDWHDWLNEFICSNTLKLSQTEDISVCVMIDRPKMWISAIPIQLWDWDIPYSTFWIILEHHYVAMRMSFLYPGPVWNLWSSPKPLFLASFGPLSLCDVTLHCGLVLDGTWTLVIGRFQLELLAGLMAEVQRWPCPRISAPCSDVEWAKHGKATNPVTRCNTIFRI